MSIKFKAEVEVMPHEALLDPQGKAVTNAMKSIDCETIQNVRIGKHVVLHVTAENEDMAAKIVDSACRQILCNMIMEQYRFTISEV